MSIRLVIAEDSYLVRESLTQLLDSDPEIDIVAVAEDTEGLRAAIEREEPDVVLTDIRMPPSLEREGIRMATHLRETRPEIGVVVLSLYAEPGFALELFDGGSAGRAYLLKERLGKRGGLTAAIRAVAEGGSVVDPKIVDTLIAERSRVADSP